MRLILVASNRNVEVIAEAFEIAGTEEKFAVHHALPADEWLGSWVATHIETSFAVGRAETIDGAIEAARTKWAAATPDLIAAKLAEAHAERQRRLADGRRPA